MTADEISFSVAFSASETVGQWVQAFMLLDKMCETGMNADEISFSSVFSASEMGGQWVQAFALLDKMRQLGMIANEFSFSSVFYKDMLPSQRARRVGSGRRPWRCSARCTKLAWQLIR